MADRSRLPRNGRLPVFHPLRERKTAKAKRVTNAKTICHDYLALRDCAAHALRVREPYRVWGGLSEDDEPNCSVWNH